MKSLAQGPRKCPHEHVPVALIRRLMGLGKSPKKQQKGLSLVKIKALTGASTQFIQMARDDPQRLAKRGCLCRYCPREELTQDEVEFLCSEKTLCSWRTFSLHQRVKLFSLRFPKRKISICKLRKVYRLNGIKLRSLKFTQKLSPTQISRQIKGKLDVLPKLIKLIEQRQNIVFVDEAVFSRGQVRARYWARAGDQSLEVPKEKLGFNAIAVVAAIDI